MICEEDTGDFCDFLSQRTIYGVKTAFAVDSWRTAQRTHHHIHDLIFEGQSTSGNSTRDYTLTLYVASTGNKSICNTNHKGLLKSVTNSSCDLTG